MKAGRLSPPPDDLTFVVGSLDSLIRVQATQKVPAVDISISGIRFTGTRYTYMDPHGIPSGGDWYVYFRIVISRALSTRFPFNGEFKFDLLPPPGQGFGAQCCALL